MPLGPANQRKFRMSKFPSLFVSRVVGVVPSVTWLQKSRTILLTPKKSSGAGVSDCEPVPAESAK